MRVAYDGCAALGSQYQAINCPGARHIDVRWVWTGFPTLGLEPSPSLGYWPKGGPGSLLRGIDRERL